MKTLETRIIEVIQRTHDVKSFRLEVKENIDFKAGQFFFITIKIEGKEVSKHFSFSNSPTERNYIEFTKRITESPFSKALDEIKPGDWVRIKLSLGSFTLDKASDKIAFLSGGIGITPIRSMCKYSTDKRLPIKIRLLYGNAKEKDIIFRTDFEKMQKANKNLRIIYTLTSPEIDKNKWNGVTGYIDAGMIRKEIPDFNERVFYMCGPSLMVQKLKDILKSDLEIKDDNIVIENFVGY